MVGSKGKRLNAFTKASAFSDDSAESDSSEDFRVPKMLSVALDKNNASEMIMSHIGQLPDSDKK
jgi:hypothetical protein